jgi:hypothetical protein
MRRNYHATGAWVWLGLLAVALLATGCRGVREKPLSPEEQHLQKFGRLYFAYRTDNKGKPPASAEELKAWAKTQGPDKLGKLGIDDVDAAFVSLRDKEPYQIVHLPMGMGPVLAHEKTGVGGKRLVMSSQGNVFEVDEKRFQEMLRSVPSGRRR